MLYFMQNLPTAKRTEGDFVMNSIQSLSHSKRRHKYHISMPDAARDWYIKRNFQAALGICLRIARRSYQRI